MPCCAPRSAVPGSARTCCTSCAPAGVEPLAPEAPLAFVFSPLVGTPLTTSAKFAVVAKSPLTDRLNDALASSHFAISGKLTGHDAIVVRGACDSPSAAIIDGDGTRIVDAPTSGACRAAEAEQRLRERLGPAYRVAAIGPAGERLVRYATVSHDGRHAGRGGLGAVLGAKRLKAVAVRAATRCPVAEPTRCSPPPRICARARSGRRPRSTATSDARQPADLQRALRPPGPQLRHREDDARLEDRAAVRDSCASCSIGCERIMSTKDGRQARVEYESAFALGPLVGIDDPDAVLDASARCDELGLDTISTGGTIAWAMEAGVAPWLTFGDPAALLRAIEEIGAREGVGDLLAEGLVGTPLTTSAKFAVVAKSPLTDRLNDALASSHFAIAGKLTGNDAIVVRGACDDAVGADRRRRRRPHRRRRRPLGPARPPRPRRGCASGSARPTASPRSARPASGSSATRPSRTTAATPAAAGSARCMGAKRLKAVAVRARARAARSPTRPRCSPRRRTCARARSGPRRRSTATLGTLSNLLTFNALSALPGHNFGAETTTLALEDRAAVRDTCASCSIGCERIMKTQGRPLARAWSTRARSRSARSSASTTPTRCCEASARCDELGLDTISTGGTIAWAMEAGRRRLAALRRRRRRCSARSS